MPEDLTDERSRKKLQWGRGFSAAERRVGPILVWWHCPLQWGRGFSAAERLVANFQFNNFLRLQWGRGFSAAESPPSRSPSNLATLLQWGRGFSAAESGEACRRLVHEARASMGPRLFSRGKGVPGHGNRHQAYASMGPRLFSRGKRSMPRRRDRQVRLQWGRGFSAAESSSLRSRGDTERASFNGAAAFQPRKGMEYSALPYRIVCFNGAAAFQPRKAVTYDPSRIDNAASMGPRLFSRGKFCSSHVHTMTFGLQWGRGFSAAESYPLLGPRAPQMYCFNGAAAFQPRKDTPYTPPYKPPYASMGPRLFSRGKPSVRPRRGPPGGASMGPRLFSRGKVSGERKT